MDLQESDPEDSEGENSQQIAGVEDGQPKELAFSKQEDSDSPPVSSSAVNFGGNELNYLTGNDKMTEMKKPGSSHVNNNKS